MDSRKSPGLTGRTAVRLKVMLHETIRNDYFLVQQSVATLLRHSFEKFQHCSNIVKLCCTKNRRCESPRVTSP